MKIEKKQAKETTNNRFYICQSLYFIHERIANRLEISLMFFFGERLKESGKFKGV
jgi:hypothetical protein